MKSTQDDKTRRFLITSTVLVFICLVSIYVSIRFADKYRDKAAETALLEQKLDDLGLDIKKLDFKTKELETLRHDLSIEKGQIIKDYSTIKSKYISLGNTIETLEKDVRDLQKIIKYVENKVPDPVIGDDIRDEKELELIELQNRNDELVKKLAVKTKEKMILKISLESQAKRLGLSENYDPELKNVLKNLVTSLQ